MAKRATLSSERGRKSDQKLKGAERIVQIDKKGDVFRNGKLIGRIELDESVFVAMDFVRRLRVRTADFDEAFRWLSQ